MNEKDVAEKLVMKLQELKRTVSTMESCTGGGLANKITNVCGASGVFNFCAVTYSNEYKIKMGVDPDVIEKYSVYSIETAREMSREISKFANSDYGIGVTGKLNCADISNQSGMDDIVYVSIYDRRANVFLDSSIRVESEDREKNKNKIILNTIEKLYNIL